MSAYVIVQATLKDLEALRRYSEGAAPTLAAHGAELVVKGAPELLTGEADEAGEAMAALIRFPDADAARRWYGSAGYQELLPIRDQAMACRFVLVGA